MKKNRFISDLKSKDSTNDVFMVKYISLMEARDGRDYLNVILADKTGDIEARKWTGARVVAENVTRGDLVRVEGKVNNYQNRLQVIIESIEAVEDGEVDRSDFVPKAATEPEKMFEDLMAIVHGLDDVYIRDLLEMTLFDSEIQRRLKTWYAGKTIHHAYESGLLEHILSCATLAVSLSKHYQVNVNYVVAGAILHDLCKVYELTDGPIADYTEEGKLVGHLVKGTELLDHFSSKIKGFPYQTKLHLKHVLLSHHGEYAYGSPKIPQTSEAFLVHLIDLMDSKMNALEIIKKTDKTPGRWSGFVKHLDRIIYKDPLPHHTEYLKEDASSSRKEETKDRPKKGKKGRSDAPLKHSLADKLKDFKVED